MKTIRLRRGLVATNTNGLPLRPTKRVPDAQARELVAKNSNMAGDWEYCPKCLHKGSN